MKIGPVRFPCFRGIDSAIRERGYPLLVTRVSRMGSIATRARQLKEQIEKYLEERKLCGPVVIAAHSMGGLDARYMISELGMASRVAALLTVSTPHRGSSWADWMLKRLRGFPIGGPAQRDLTVSSCAQFNERVPDAPGVKYFSICGMAPIQRIPLFSRKSYRVIFEAEGENDGLVSVRSATWGTHLETWEANHWEQRNVRLPGFVRDMSEQITPRWVAAVEKAAAAV